MLALLPTLMMSVSSAIPSFRVQFDITLFSGLLSPSIIIWLTEFSYRDVQSIVADPWNFPYLRAIGLPVSSESVPVSLTCLLGIIIPINAGMLVMRYNVQHFDRLTGRPWRKSSRIRSTSLGV